MIDKYFEEILKKLENKPDEVGHYNLLNDIWAIWKDAVNHEFHDFKNTKYDAPKMALHEIILLMDTKIKSGAYDN